MRFSMSVALLVVTTALSPLVAKPPKDKHAELAARANRFIDHLAKEEFDKATQIFDGTMTKAMPSAKLKLTWQSLLQVYGALESRGEVHQEKVSKYDIVYVPCRFKKKALDVKVVFDKEKRIAGLFFVPSKPEREHKLAAYVKKTAFQESEMFVGADPWKLPGTLAVPNGKGSFPAVVLVHGSGPNDRDETVGANKPFKDLGMGLASKGIVTLRYDKRTKVHGLKMIASKEVLTVKQETVDDVILAVRKLRDNSAVDGNRIFVVGHSLGGYLVPRIDAADADKLIAGYVVLAGSTRPIEDLMWEQFNYILNLDGTLSDADKKQLAKLKDQIQKIKSTDLVDQPSKAAILGAGLPYWIDLRGYEPAKDATKIKRPMYILQGERDYQVTMTDFGNWKEALASQDNVQFKSYPSLNHLFIAGKGKSTPSEYSVRGNVSESVLDDIVDWINRH